MRFGTIPAADSEGALLAHATVAGDRRMKKGHRVTADDAAALSAAGVDTVVAVRLSADDVEENEAAVAIAAALRIRNTEAKPPATGRVNLYAAAAGVFRVSKPMIDAINRIDPAITIATLGDLDRVEAGQMVATVKIIPFAAARRSVEAAMATGGEGEVFSVEPFAARRVAMIQTVLPTVKKSVLDKTVAVTEDRLARSGSAIELELRPPHRADDLAEAIGKALGRADLLLVFGASALCDFDDVIPAAIRLAGGRVEHAGMPVDPGNLLVLGEVSGIPVLGAPGCARSPKDNGFDWVLDRILAGIPVTTEDITGMGVGGLLMEIPTRPQPREPRRRQSPEKVHVVVLAAGRSSRMGGPNKLLAAFDDQPLVRRTVERALASGAAGVTVVVGHQADRVREALDGLPVAVVENPDFAAGLSASLKAGVAAVPTEASAAMIMLADMPGVEAGDLDRLIGAYGAGGGLSIVRATHAGKSGNPVVLPRALFSSVDALEGDTGARALVEAAGADVIDVEIGSGASLDVDTPEAMRLAGGVLQD